MGGIALACSSSAALDPETTNIDAEDHCLCKEHYKDVNQPQLSFEEAVKEIRKLLRKKEAKQIELHNEVIQWRLNDLRGTWRRENREHAYDLIKQFIELHEDLDEVFDVEKAEVDRLEIECEASYRHALESKELSSAEDIRFELDPMLLRRKTYFQRFHERHVKLLLLVLGEIQECRRMVDEVHESCENERS